MKIFFRILKVLAVLIITVILSLFTASFLMQNKVADYIIKSLNKNIATKFEFGSVRLSFLRKFPEASLDLKNVLVHSSPGYDKTGFTTINTDTLLAARSVLIEFDITDIINGIYNIERIGINEGRLNLFTDTSGFVNYEIIADSSKNTNVNFRLNLDRILISDLYATYNNLATKLIIKGFIENGRLKSLMSGDNIDFTAAGEMQIDFFKLYDFIISKDIAADLNINLQRSGKGILFNKSSIVLNNFYFGLSGFVSADNVLDLSLSGKNIDIAGIKNYFPEKLQEKIAEYNPAGVMNIDSKIKGRLSRTENPSLDINFNLDKGSVSYGHSALKINDLSFKGFFTNGPGKVPKTSSLSISDFNGVLGSSKYNASLLLSDFDTLNMTLQLKGKVIPVELKEFFNLKNISSAKGDIDLDLKMDGIFQKKEKYVLWDIFSLNPVADLTFNSFGLGLKNDKTLIDKVNGSLLVGDTVVAKNFRLTYKDQNFHFNGIFINLPEWLAGNSVFLKVSADVTCNKLVPELLFPAWSKKDSSIINKTAYSFPGDIMLDLNFKIDNLVYKTFQAEKINGTLSYKPRILNFKTLNLNSLDGIISGNGFIVQNTDKSFIGRGSFNFEKININKAFVTFHNFSQNFIKAENLAGTLSGSLSLLIPMDSLMNPEIKSISAEGKYLISNGALINFEPVKELSSFIEISELENISFERLENNFFIKNNFLYTPQMDVRSSAADLIVNGKHSFDNNYEYHVKILLSEMLSKKIKKPKPNTTEFGAVQDDGLGRTSLLLRIENKGEDIKVGYDIKAAGNQIKNEIKSEKQTLKTILKEEYGWFKNDSTVNKTKPNSSPRFRITWEETDSVKVENEPPAEKKESAIKNLFKKK
ncbi:MAG: hypothetical protein NTZ85_13285 [Bacteroidia bacterium]|nr:hypothetical protein [Bacteroidia bacterium]